MVQLTLSTNRLVATAYGNLAAGTGGITSTFTTPTGQVVNIVNGIAVNVCGNGVGASGPINTAYFSNLESAIGAAKVCSELQAQVNFVFAGIQAQVTDANAQIAALLPILALLSPPSSPTDVVTWIGNFITGFLTPYVIPYTTLATQLTELSTQIVSLTSAINAAASGIPGGCSITIPSITGI